MRRPIINKEETLRKLFSIALLFVSIAGLGQKAEPVADRMRRFHQLMVEDAFTIDQYLDDSLSYGHSNGWIESKKDFLEDLGGRLIYHSIKEDSIKVSVNKGIAHVRFVGDFDVTLDGKRNTFHLRVLEIWVKRGNNWKIFARQAIR